MRYSYCLCKCFALSLLLLFIYSSALSADPGWAPKSGAMSMAVYGQVYLDNHRIESSSYVIAAFGPGGDSDCRGRSPVNRIFGEWGFYLAVASNSAGESIQFKIWDSATDEIHEFQETVVFESGAFMEKNIGMKFSVYPSMLEIDGDLGVTVLGSGFNAQTRVSMYPDSGNKNTIIGSVETPGHSYFSKIVGNKAFVADANGGLQIIDISSSSDPAILGAVETNGAAYEVDVWEERAFVADGEEGLCIIDVSNPEAPEILGSIDTAGCAYGVDVIDNTAYIAEIIGGLHIIDVSDPAAPAYIGSIQPGGHPSGVRVIGDRAFIAGYEYGFQVIDISMPDNPKLITQLETPGLVRNIEVDRNRAYLADQKGFRIVDIADPDNPKLLGGVDTPGYAHDVCVSGDRAYISDMHSGVHIIDISDPANPHIVGGVDTPASANGVAVINETAYLSCSWRGFYAVDVGQPVARRLAGSIVTPAGYNGIIMDGETAYMAAAGTGLQVIDVSDPSNPRILDTVVTPGEAQELALSGDTIYLADGESGLQIIDISNPADRSIIGAFDTTMAYDIVVDNTMAFIADGESGLKSIDIQTPSAPSLIGSVDTPGLARGLAISGDIAYVADGLSGLQVIDIGNPADPVIVKTLDTPGEACDVAVSGNRAFVADKVQGVQIIDIADPANPSIIRRFSVLCDVKRISIVDNTAYINDFCTGVHAADIQNPDAPVITGYLDFPGQVFDISIKNNNVFAAADFGLAILPAPVEIASPAVNSETKISATLPAPGLSGDYILRIFDAVKYDELSVTFEETAKITKAVIIAGGDPSPVNALWDGGTRMCAVYAYRALLFQGFKRENILFLSADASDITKDIDGDGVANDVDREATLENVSFAFDEWARTGPMDELLIYMTNHGGDGTFRLNRTEMLAAELLDGLLDNWRIAAGSEKRLIFIYDACRSGSFLAHLTPPEGMPPGILITSTTADEPAFFMEKGGISFSFQFWASVYKGADLDDAFYFGKEMMRMKQTACLDADGDGVPGKKNDKLTAEHIRIGRGYIPASDIPAISTVSGEQTLYGRTEAVISAETIIDADGVKRVWAVITPPDFNTGDPDTPVIDGLPTIELTDPDNDGRYEGACDLFTKQGTYQIAVYAMDRTNMYSLPAETAVHQIIGDAPAGYTISGRAATDIAGYEDLSIPGATVALEGYDFQTTTDHQGCFTLDLPETVPSGDYNLIITSPNLEPAATPVSITSGSNLALDDVLMTPGPDAGCSYDALNESYLNGRRFEQQFWDANGDGKKGLEEAIDALRVTSGAM